MKDLPGKPPNLLDSCFGLLFTITFIIAVCWGVSVLSGYISDLESRIQKLEAK